MTISVMLDLETWGTKPGCDIRSIGACVFTLDGGVGDTFYIATDNPTGYWGGRFGTLWNASKYGPLKYRLDRDASTVRWWKDQSEEAQAAFTDPVELPGALRRFTAWYESVGGTHLWAHGSHFDIPILAAAYDVCKLPVPWHYRAPRDTRTLFDAAGIDDHSAWLMGHSAPGAVLHHALNDAICQARAVCAAYARIRP